MRVQKEGQLPLPFGSVSGRPGPEDAESGHKDGARRREVRRRFRKLIESAPASDRVFSVFEQHVELTKRGKQSKPVEFGHKVLLSQTR